MFLENNVCIIHGDPSYPAVCRGFPWMDAEHGGPYEFDQTICPEFLAGSRMVQIQGIGRRAKRPGSQQVMRAGSRQFRRGRLSPLSGALMGLRLSFLTLTSLFASPLMAQTDAQLAHAKKLLEQTILIDGHNDLPWEIRTAKALPATSRRTTCGLRAKA